MIDEPEYIKVLAIKDFRGRGPGTFSHNLKVEGLRITPDTIVIQAEHGETIEVSRISIRYVRVHILYGVKWTATAYVFAFDDGNVLPTTEEVLLR